MNIEQIPCRWPLANYTPGVAVGRGNPSMLVLHHMAGYMAGSISRFQDPSAHVSAHYLIEDTRVVQMVRDSDVAYHAGNWQVNVASIGIEHSGNAPLNGGGQSPIDEATVQSSIELCTELCRTYGINPFEQVAADWWNPASGQIETHMVFKVCAHHDVDRGAGNTACPGQLPIDRIRSAVAANLAGHSAPAPTPSGQTYVFNDYLTPGMSNDDRVKDMQRCLQKLSYFPQDIDITGNYGNITAHAVLAFQKSVNIMNNDAVYGQTFGAGWFGPRTRTALTNKHVAIN